MSGGVGEFRGRLARLNITDLACVTWATGLLIATILIVHPLTAARISLEIVVFVSGVPLIVTYRKRASGRDGHCPS
jgi:hypothetical protein